MLKSSAPEGLWRRNFSKETKIIHCNVLDDRILPKLEKDAVTMTIGQVSKFKLKICIMNKK